ncbi:MAG: hypothetical protein LBD51_03100, partial [Bifidobacteriaceae bacterium]|nr:hypothetical protein [Bifidobacteriaceae bacterium]
MVCGFALVSAAALGFKALQAEAAPSQLVLVVNTVEAGTSDAAKGDGVCATDQGLCSLRAAIEESNATKGDTEVSIEVAPGVNGSILMTTSDSTWMTKDNPTGKDSGAYFHVTRTVSIDLDNRLGVKASSNGDAAAFWIEAPNTKLLRFSNIFPGETAIVFGPDADGSTLDGGQTIQTENWNTERLVWIRGGADNITV